MYNCLVYLKCARSEMDITTVFGTVILGSNPGGRTNVSSKKANCFAFGRIRKIFLYFAKQNEKNTWLCSSRSWRAHKLAIPTSLFYKGKTVDNRVYIVYKGHR